MSLHEAQENMTCAVVDSRQFNNYNQMFVTNNFMKELDQIAFDNKEIYI